MDIEKIKQLIELIENSGLAEIEIHEGEESVRISRASTLSYAAPAPQQVVQLPAANAVAHQSEQPTAAQPNQLTGHVVRSPMVGTVYLASSPETDDFVKVGQSVKEGDTICLVEAMKMFNQIVADKSGVIKARLVDSGSPVEFDQPLFIIE